MLTKGRTKIVSEFKATDMINYEMVKAVINSTINTHAQNKNEIDYLINYRNGQQQILLKKKDVRPEINNKLVVNHAQMITRMISGYFLGTPIQYVQSGSDKKQEIDQLNLYLNYEDKASVDKELADYQSICGTAYRIIYTDGLYGDEVPFEDRCLNPSNTYVVYQNDVTEKPILAVNYFDLLDDKLNVVGRKYYAYTDYGLYYIQTKNQSGVLDGQEIYVFEEYSVGGIPVIEYPNNQWRIGDWELCIGLMEAINKLQSGRLDDIDQVVQSLIVFINADIDSSTYQEMRASGVVSLVNKTNNKTEVNTISTPLDQAGLSVTSEQLEELLYALLGIPDRNNRAGGGGDTGQAVELRDGWADLEIVARNKELTFRKSEKQALKIMLTIMNNKDGTDLSLLDINIKFSRNKNNNLLVKTQAYMNLISTKTLDPADCLTIVDLVSDVNDYMERGKTFWGEQFASIDETKQSTTAIE